MIEADSRSRLEGIWLAILTYTIWGLFPFYFNLLQGVSALEILVHRIVWSSLLTLILVCVSGKGRFVLGIYASFSELKPYLFSSLFLGINWALYIYGIELKDVLQLSLAYYINPLFNMLFGLFLFKERVGLLGKVAIVLALLGLTYRLSDFNHFPWLAVVIGLAFSIYGALRKQTKGDSISALFVESTVLLPLALLAFFFYIDVRTFELIDGNIYWLLLFALAGPVTSFPLLTFSMAIKRIPYYLIGFIQYLAPTMLFLSAIWVFGEKWQVADLITFGAVWLGVILVVIEQAVAIGRRKQ